MLIAVVLQAVATLLAGMITWLVWGPAHAVSLLAGGGSIVVPNALLALRLRSSAPRHAPVVLVVGEFIKVGLSVLLLWLCYRVIAELSWGALIAGVVVALKALLLAPWAQSLVDRAQARDMEQQDQEQQDQVVAVITREHDEDSIGTKTTRTTRTTRPHD